MIVLILIIYSLLILYDFIPLYKQKLWKDFWVNSIITFASLVIAILLSFGVKIPSPSEPIKRIVTSIFGK